MRPPSPRSLLRILNSLNWIGHVDLSQGDLQWLARELSIAFNPASRACECCDSIKPILIYTRIGRMCEDCIDDAAQEARETRRSLE